MCGAGLASVRPPWPAPPGPAAGQNLRWSSLYAPCPGAPAAVPATEDWAFDGHIPRGGSFRHDRDLARCARRHGACEPDLEAIGVGFRLAAPAA